MLSYVTTHMRTKVQHLKNLILNAALVLLPEVVLFKFQCMFLMWYGNLKINSMQNTGRIFWFIYFNFYFEDGDFCVSDLDKLLILKAMGEPEFSFEYDGFLISNKSEYKEEFNQLIYKFLMPLFEK